MFEGCKEAAATTERVTTGKDEGTEESAPGPSPWPKETNTVLTVLLGLSKLNSDASSSHGDGGVVRPRIGRLGMELLTQRSGKKPNQGEHVGLLALRMGGCACVL